MIQMKFKKYIILIVILFILFVLNGCPDPSNSDNPENQSEPADEPLAPISEDTLQTSFWYTILPLEYEQTGHPSLPLTSEELLNYTFWVLVIEDEDPNDSEEEMTVYEYDSTNDEWVDAFGFGYTVIFLEKESDTVYRWEWVDDKLNSSLYVETIFEDKNTYYDMEFDIYNDPEFTDLNISYESRNDPTIYHPDLPEYVRQQ